MKKTLILSLFIISVLLLFFAAAAAYPYYIYGQVLQGDYENDWFEVRSYKDSLLVPDEAVELSNIDKSNEDLWSKFHLMDVVIPLPVQNPFYNITADIQYDKKKKINNLGLVVLGTNNKEILKIYFNQNSSMPNVINNQKLFKLPIVKKIISSFDDNKVWRDIFSKDISDWNLGVKDMIYHLYLLELRSRLVPKRVVSYKLLKDSDTVIIEVESKNKDYRTELVLTRSRGFIYSYLLVTRLKSDESKKLRERLLDGITFRAGSEYLSRIIYQEFKNLSFKNKTDHMGMLYLISAWSHNPNNEALIQEMIFYLQRGESNEKQIEPLIEYAYRRYDKTFVTKDISNLNLDEKIIFKSKVELEKENELKEVKAATQAIDTTPVVPEKNIFDKKLDEAKKNIKTKKTRMIIE